MGNGQIEAGDIVASVAAALQHVSYFHPTDFVAALKRAYEAETHGPARNALLQLLVNSRMAAIGHRPVCQDTGVVHVYARLGMDARIRDGGSSRTPSLQALVNRAVGQAYLDSANPLRASVVRDPLGKRINTGDNSPAVLHVELVEGCTLDLTVVAKGGGGDVKARYTMLNPSDSVADWIVSQLPGMGAGWCPPGVLGVGVGGSPEQAMAMAKQSLFVPIDIDELKARGPHDAAESLRLTLFDRINALGIGAQGLGGDITLLDVKVAHAPSHAALLPVAILPNCAATRYISFTMDGSGPVHLQEPDLEVWSGIPDAMPLQDGIPVNLDTLSPADIEKWKAGDVLLLSGRLITGRDAAHKRMADALAHGEALPVDLRGRAIYYVGPVDPVGDEAVGPAGPTTANRMDKFMPELLEKTGLLLSIGKAERGPVAIEAIRKARSAYLVAVGGAAYLVSKSVHSARVLAYEDLGMEAMYELVVENMPVLVGIDSSGKTVHRTIPITPIS